MELTLMGPTGSETMSINWLEVFTEQGNHVILPGHAPMVLVLKPNKEIAIELWDCTRNDRIITSGIVHVTRDAVTILVNHA